MEFTSVQTGNGQNGVTIYLKLLTLNTVCAPKTFLRTHVGINRVFVYLGSYIILRLKKNIEDGSLAGILTHTRFVYITSIF